jgi:hypothetical protein
MVPTGDNGFDQLLLVARTFLRNKDLQPSPEVFNGVEIGAVSWP